MANIGFEGFCLYKPETWLPVLGNWCGPGWSAGRRTAPGETVDRSVGVDGQVDAACKAHDLDYEDAANQPWPDSQLQKLQADWRLLQNLAAMDWSTLSNIEAAYAQAMGNIFALKMASIDLASIGLDPIAETASDLLRQLNEEYKNKFGRDSQLPKLLEPFLKHLACEIPPSASDAWQDTQQFAPRRDPLTFDLDGDGLETIGINPANPILFDHDGDGLKTATGWISPDDAFLVLDRNGNGTIDSGRELFGDSTPLSEGGNAADGFAALAQEDTNSDGKVDSNDARFSQLRLWQDLNQDGISQAGELFTLNQKGIASIYVGKTENSTLLPNGNVIADLGSYTRTDGTTGGLGTATGQLGDVDLREDTFHSEFTDAIPLTPETESLPDMHCYRSQFAADKYQPLRSSIACLT